MKSKEILHELVHSLSKSEKRYFKVFTSVHKESNNYLKLFTAIQTQKKYNEKALIEEFAAEDFVRQFSTAKNYLLNLILKSLSNYHKKSKKSIELNDHLTEIEILYWKGLYKLAYKRINQAKKIAIKYDLLPYLLLLNHWDKNVEEFVSKEVMSDTIVQHTKILLESYNEQMQFTFLSKKMENATKATMRSTTQTLDLVKKVLSNDLMLQNENEIENFYSKVDYLFLKGVGYSITGEEEKEYKYKKKLIDFLESNPHQIIENPIKYAAALKNILIYYYYQDYTDNYPLYLDKLENVNLKFAHAKNSYIDITLNLKLGYYLFLRDKSKIIDVIEEIKAWYFKTESKRSTQAKMISEYNIALAYFFLEEIKPCLKWCNSAFTLFDLKSKNFRHDLAISILVIQILVYYKLKHYDLGIKTLKMVADIAKTNNYIEAEIQIYKEVWSLLKNFNEEEVIINISTIMQENKYTLINLDSDVMKFWLESKTKKSQINSL